MREVVFFAGGCFWCTEAVFRRLKGVISVECGYTGGSADSPTYELVCTGSTGHAEAVRVTYDTDQIPFAQLLDVFFTTHDPTTPNRQGHDMGTQYRSAIFCTTAGQLGEAQQKIADLDRSHRFRDPLVTQVVRAGSFYLAEAEHQGYEERHPGAGYVQAVIVPKLAKLTQCHRQYLKPEERQGNR
ncbi:putative Peptide methionine sulfoxide reductase MsrA [Paratrimastix pyriformis]|uniref:peptide-methionine (S)-S-oxide reductase n=1 Tax=Paratrimastix pyriformis TaxID=342808 RepID=A0ABQ8UH21_9EUKA|nr:putative Peptide methionine sulfoxide reductase MsrA [Paratrimastix pyriformis]